MFSLFDEVVVLDTEIFDRVLKLYTAAVIVAKSVIQVCSKNQPLKWQSLLFVSRFNSYKSYTGKNGSQIEAE